MTAPAVAVAVVSWNTRDLLRTCLRSLAGEVDAGRAEVIVVDNASTDGSPEMVAEEFPWATLVVRDDNPGFGRAVNDAATRTRAPWLAPANADVAVGPGAISALLNAAERDPDAAVIAPRLVRPDGSTQHSVHSFPTVTLSAIVALGAHRLSRRLGDRLCIEGMWEPDRARRVDWVHGAFLIVRREAFDAVGGFDRDQWMYAEDLDLCWRLARSGHFTRYEPSAHVRHEVSAATTQAFPGRKVRQYMTASYAWMVRRRGLAVTRLFAVVNLAGAGMRLVAFAPLAAASPRRFKPSREHARAYFEHHRIGLQSRQATLDGAVH